jgi:CD109 antigen
LKVKAKAQPGDQVNVQVSADPMSVVNLLAVDQSVLLLKSGNDITPSEVSCKSKVIYILFI